MAHSDVVQMAREARETLVRVRGRVSPEEEAYLYRVESESLRLHTELAMLPGPLRLTIEPHWDLRRQSPPPPAPDPPTMRGEEQGMGFRPKQGRRMVAEQSVGPQYPATLEELKALWRREMDLPVPPPLAPASPSRPAREG